MHFLITKLASGCGRLAVGRNVAKYYQNRHLLSQRNWPVLLGNRLEACGSDGLAPFSFIRQRSQAVHPKAEPPEENSDVIFPNPVHGLKQLNSLMQDKLNMEPIFTLSSSCDPKEVINTVELTLNWPEKQTFIASAREKKQALRESCGRALHWLHANKHITRALRPIMAMDTSSKNTINLNFTQSEINQVDEVLQLYSEEVVPALSNFDRTWKFYDNDMTHLHPTLGIPYPLSENLENWNKKLKPIKQNHKIPTLPIDSFREEILQAIKSHRVVLVRGATGCGKTTKVPQFILDEAIAEGQGAYCNIAVCMPRRLTAKETARYVAHSRRESIGRSVGFNVRMDRNLPSVIGGSISFMTGQKLALKFTGNTALRGVSHVVLDEVHLRDIGTDLTMNLLRQALAVNEDLKVIIMSATIQSDIFQSYFSSFGPMPVIEVPGRTYPVKEHFLEDLPSVLIPEKQSNLIDDEISIDYKLVQNVVSWIHETKPAGGILVFVSGWSDIVELTKLIQGPDLEIFPVHRKLKDNSAALRPLKNGRRKVVLATNVAETSITFPDIVYVVDCGIHKTSQRKFISRGRWSAAEVTSRWISTANAVQRRGRAGRVSPGECYHLFTKETYEQMVSQELPGILSCPLESVVMMSKLVNPKMDAADLFKEFPDPPTDKDISETVKTLKKLSFLSHTDETPTALAVAAMKMSAPLPSAKALIYSAIFRCMDTMVAVLSSEEETPLNVTGGTEERKLKISRHISSDHLAKAQLIDSCYRTKNLQNFYKSMLMRQNDLFRQIDMNEHDSEMLVQSILLHSFGSLLVSVKTPTYEFMIDHSGTPAKISSRSVNYDCKKMPYPFATYLKRQGKDRFIFVDDTSSISPLSVLLFLPSHFKIEEVDSDKLKVSGWRNQHVKIVLSKENYARIEQLRKCLNDLVDYFVITEILNYPEEHYNLLCKFRSALLLCLNNMLSTDLNQESSI